MLLYIKVTKRLKRMHNAKISEKLEIEAWDQQSKKKGLCTLIVLFSSNQCFISF